VNRRKFIHGIAGTALVGGTVAAKSAENLHVVTFDLGVDGTMAVYQTSGGICIDRYSEGSSCASWRSEVYSNGTMNVWDGGWNNGKTFNLV
jgi:hypothetical protein